MKILLNMFINTLKGKYYHVSSKADSFQACFIKRYHSIILTPKHMLMISIYDTNGFLESLISDDTWKVWLKGKYEPILKSMMEREEK